MASSNIEITEKVWQKQVEQLAKTLGYKVYHTFLSRWSDAGFPDLLLVRAANGPHQPGQVLFAELKREKGKLTPSQQDWIDTLRASGALVYVWRPSDFDSIVELLRRRSAEQP